MSVPLSYLGVHLAFVIPPIVGLGWLAHRREGAWLDRQTLSGLAIVIALAVGYTTPWTNALIPRGVWWYGEGAVLATVWHTPVEEYLFFVLQPTLTALWLVHVLDVADRPLSIPTDHRVAGALAGLGCCALGWFLLEGTTFYLGAILVWAGPILAIQWAFGSTYLRETWRTVALGIAGPTLYLWIVDAIAIDLGVWRISEAHTVGLAVAGLPVEEALFFLVTNAFVVQGLVLYVWLLDRRHELPGLERVDDRVARGKRIQRSTGTTFALATRVLPERVRHPTYVLYGFFRIADEVVDDPDPAPPDRQRAELERIRRAALGERDADEPVLAAFSDVRERCGIDDADVECFMDAMWRDVDVEEYETAEDLAEYVEGSAAAVGRMMTDVMGVADRDAALSHASALGVAFQLTNFLRDVREDALEYDRVYVPAETLRAHGASVEDVRSLEFHRGVADAIGAELRRAERRYEEGVAGISYLPEDCQFPVLLAAVCYADHHRLIRARSYDTLSATPELSTRRTLRLAVETALRWRLTRDPVAVFWAVTEGFEVDAPPEEHPHGRSAGIEGDARPSDRTY